MRLRLVPILTPNYRRPNVRVYRIVSVNTTTRPCGHEYTRLIHNEETRIIPNNLDLILHELFIKYLNNHDNTRIIMTHVSRNERTRH